MSKRPQLVTPLDRVEALPDFEGLPTIAVSLEVRGIEGGFNEGLTIDPVVLHKGDRVFLLVEGVVDDINHKSVKDADAWRRAHVIRVDAGTLVDAEFAEVKLGEQRLRIEAAHIERERAEGIHRLPLAEGDDDEDDEDAALARSHNAGAHVDGLRPECVLCRLEAENAAEENGTTVDEELERRRVAE